jgi:hypothetical protein
VEIVSKEHLEAAAEVSRVKVSERPDVAAWKIYAPVVVMLAVVSQFYFFRELEAALLFFTILFLMLAAVGGAIYLIGCASQKTFSIAEPAARRGLVFAEVVSRKTFHRPRSVPVP